MSHSTAKSSSAAANPDESPLSVVRVQVQLEEKAKVADESDMTPTTTKVADRKEDAKVLKGKGADAEVGTDSKHDSCAVDYVDAPADLSVVDMGTIFTGHKVVKRVRSAGCGRERLH